MTDDDYEADQRYRGGDSRDDGEPVHLSVGQSFGIAAVVFLLAGIGCVVVVADSHKQDRHREQEPAVDTSMSSEDGDPAALSSYRSKQRKDKRLQCLNGVPGQWVIIQYPECDAGMSCSKFRPYDNYTGTEQCLEEHRSLLSVVRSEQYKVGRKERVHYDKKPRKTWMGTGAPPWAK